jgi:hypothetical protein
LLASCRPPLPSAVCPKVARCGTLPGDMAPRGLGDSSESDEEDRLSDSQLSQYALMERRKAETLRQLEEGVDADGDPSTMGTFNVFEQVLDVDVPPMRLDDGTMMSESGDEGREDSIQLDPCTIVRSPHSDDSDGRPKKLKMNWRDPAYMDLLGALFSWIAGNHIYAKQADYLSNKGRYKRKPETKAGGSRADNGSPTAAQSCPKPVSFETQYEGFGKLLRSRYQELLQAELGWVPKFHGHALKRAAEQMLAKWHTKKIAYSIVSGCTELPSEIERPLELASDEYQLYLAKKGNPKKQAEADRLRAVVRDIAENGSHKRKHPSNDPVQRVKAGRHVKLADAVASLSAVVTAAAGSKGQLDHMQEQLNSLQETSQRTLALMRRSVEVQEQMLALQQAAHRS